MGEEEEYRRRTPADMIAPRDPARRRERVLEEERVEEARGREAGGGGKEEGRELNPGLVVVLRDLWEMMRVFDQPSDEGKKEEESRMNVMTVGGRSSSLLEKEAQGQKPLDDKRPSGRRGDLRLVGSPSPW